MELLAYLKKHIIVTVGKPSAKNCIVVEAIVDNPEQLIEKVIECNCYISEIRWWDRALISSKSKIGYGGTIDLRGEKEYYFAETDICSLFKSDTTIDEYISYINDIKNKHIEYDLYPAFDIYIKQ